MGYRSLLMLFALYSIIEKPFGTALMAIFFLGGLLLIGESIYKTLIAYEQRMRALQKERELREQRAEEARLRQEALKRAQEASAKEFDVFDNDRQPASGASSTPSVKEETATP